MTASTHPTSMRPPRVRRDSELRHDRKTLVLMILLFIGLVALIVLLASTGSPTLPIYEPWMY